MVSGKPNSQTRAKARKGPSGMGQRPLTPRFQVQIKASGTKLHEAPLWSSLRRRRESGSVLGSRAFNWRPIKKSDKAVIVRSAEIPSDRSTQGSRNAVASKFSDDPIAQ